MTQEKMPNPESVMKIITATRVLHDLLLSHERFKKDPLSIPGTNYGYNENECRHANSLHIQFLERRILEECKKAGIQL